MYNQSGKRALWLFMIILILTNSINMSLVVRAKQNQTATVWREYYVSTTGSDENPGTKEAPFKMIQKAKDVVRTISSGMAGDIVINISQGYYFLDDTFDFTTEDSGKNGFNIIYRGDKKICLLFPPAGKLRVLCNHLIMTEYMKQI